MYQRIAPLRSPVALLTCCALLCAALASVVAFAGRAAAAPTTVGSFTLSPSTGKITDDPPAASATTSAGCADGTGTAFLGIYKPGASDTSSSVKKIASGTPAVTQGTAPFTVQLVAAGTTIETALRTYVPSGSLDGTYTLTLTCGRGFTTGGRFLAKIRIEGENWSLLQQQTTSLDLTAPASEVPVKSDLKLTAAVKPEAATGSVEFKKDGQSLGKADVSGGTAELTVQAPAIGGPHTYTADFTPTDADAYSASTDSVTAGIGYLLTAKNADGETLTDKSTLAIGETAKITIQGFTPGSTVEVSQLNATEATFPDATANADGTVTDYAYTVPDRTISGETEVYFEEGGSGNNRATFTFDAVDEPTDEPTDPAGLEVTDEDGNTLGADPNLEPGQTVKITAAGYAADAAVKVTLADSEETFEDAEANAEGTVEAYEFTVPEEIEDGDHTLTLAEDKTDGHSVDFAFTTGEESSESPDPSGSEPASGDTSGTDNGGTDGGGSGGDTGGSGTGTDGSGGTMASTGAQVGTIALTSLALLFGGAALVLHMRRKGLLAFPTDTPQHR
ncbi:hypothetical protein J7I94_19935 [Streptomyces sp. ISL-12]|uniref:hypothetical protein n=1 Tax=Streptomyces sp. ISL-12 TaxID=2819177 RepID=UPI001BE73B9E|nr:hypothetical protein [Streptomyces sp. ISL-12]MBT2412802.1 hypothetical protein [Streptomyces sp. ISL-12]